MLLSLRNSSAGGAGGRSPLAGARGVLASFPFSSPQAAQEQGVPGDAVPWPEREVSSLPFPSPAAAGGTGKVPE